MANPILKAGGLHKSYTLGRTEVKVLHSASLSFEQGEFLVVMGASGSGKSTLLHLLGALDVPDRGSVHFRGESVFDKPPALRNDYRNRDVGFVFQFYHLLPELTVLENVLMPAMVGCSVWEWKSTARTARKTAMQVLERVGLQDRLKHRPRELSGGERQRAAVARALVHRPALLLADEPTGNLDARIGAEILCLLREFNRAGQTMIMVTHDADVASQAHRCVHLAEGVIRDGGHHPGERSQQGSVSTKVAL